MTGFTRGIARKLLTDEQRWAFWLFRKSLRSTAVRTLAGVLSSPLRMTSPMVRTTALETLEVAERLDYDRYDIYLVCQSPKDVARLSECAKEPETIGWIETFVSSGDVLWDIGSNVGAYSLVASKFTKGAVKIYAFEPSFSSFAQLSRNIRLNQCQDSITPLHIALSSRTDISYLHSASIASGSARHQLHETSEIKADSTRIKYVQPVLAYRIDDLVRHFPVGVPNHIKLDVDGNEYDVLLGAEETLSDPRVKTILMEFDERQQKSAEALQCLQSKGFRIHSRRNHFGKQIWNYILLRDSAL